VFENRVLRRIFGLKRDEVQCGILNISQPYRPPQPIMGIALLFTAFLWFPKMNKHE
jgi:hypothetical protein